MNKGRFLSETLNSKKLGLMDANFPDEQKRWNQFFANLSIDHPLSTDLPDVSLLMACESGLIKPCKVLEIGCGNGRNAIFLAKQGFTVCAIDLSDNAIAKSIQNAKNKLVVIDLQQTSFFDFENNGSFDLIYDSGFFHHIFPHRRSSYLDKLLSLLSKEGSFGLTAFNEKMGCQLSDEEIYKSKDMAGGISYPKQKLKRIFESHFELQSYQLMENQEENSESFGYDFLSTSFWKRKDVATCL